MDELLDRLYVGNDEDYENLRNKSGWSILRCCKEGPGGHRQTLGYTTPGAPKGPRYLVVRNGSHMALNFIDPHDPNFIKVEMVVKGIDFIRDRLDAGDKVLVACNEGHSRGPVTAMLYMRSVGELPGSFVAGEHVYRTLCPSYRPGIGMRQFARTHWNALERKHDGG